MNTLYLLRHAKSSWKDAALKDFERPLNKRGLKDIKVIGRFMRAKKISPALIISSPAERARQTAELLLKALPAKIELRFDERIYEASAERLLEVLSQIEDSSDSVLLVGHNPGLVDVTGRLTGTNSHLPTATLVSIELPIEKWSKIRGKIGELKFLATPKSAGND
ncbi:MAG TPA: histidine phosphatase family protein [Pyrinomonadaceae bacterium]|jgi:phosphohistidine phosphatase|nr:histidine phosphatase family protein [Pyrinomonadaceae bacterium]